MLDGEDKDGVAEVAEAKAVVADAQPQFGRLDVLEALHVALAGGKIAGHDVQDAQSGGLIDGAEVGRGLIRPGDLLLPRLPAGTVRFWFERSASHALEVLRRKAELGQDFLVSDGLVVLEPDLGSGDGAGLFLANRLVLDGSLGDAASHWIEHDFEQSDDGGDLSGGHAVDRFVRVLLRVGRAVSHNIAYLKASTCSVES